MRDTPFDLFQKYLDDRISRAELDELMRYVGRPENREQLRSWVNTAIANGESPLQADQLKHLLEGLDNRVLERVKGLIQAEDQASKKRVRQLYAPLVAAMVLLLTIGTGVYLNWFNGDAKSKTSSRPSIADIEPGGNRAILTMEGHSAITLDSGQVGVKVKDGELRYEGGKLIAKVKAATAEAVQYAILATPRGGQYQLTLSDGTHVWLNAASSLKYPTHFTGNIREVELIGEGYFDVAKDSKRPFVVKSNGQQIRVLGTQFNVNTYPNEEEVTTTLVEGMVDVFDVRSKTSYRLKPGEQAIRRRSIVDVDQVNVSYYTSWKEGRFTFNRAKLPVILRQIERWYDVEFVYKSTDVVDVQLWGALSREVMLSKLLEVLTLNTGIKFKQEGRKVVMSQ